MRTNLKVILSAVGVAALLASPAMAKTARHQAAASTVNLPSDARGSAASYGYGVSEGGPYTPSAPVKHGVDRDFQGGRD